MSSVRAVTSTYKGCFIHGNPEDLNFYVYNMDYNSVTLCRDTCAFHQYTVAGLQGGGHCYCGNTYSHYSVANAADCNSACSGNSQEMCGGPSATSIYELQLTSECVCPLFTCPTRLFFLPGNVTVRYNYTGCYVRYNGQYDLPFYAYDSSYTPISSCAWMCAWFNYTFAGMYTSTCRCGNSCGNFGPAPSSSSCNITCSTGTEMCGGSASGTDYNSVYRVNGTVTVDTTVTTQHATGPSTAGPASTEVTSSASTQSVSTAHVGSGSTTWPETTQTGDSVSQVTRTYWAGQPARLLNHTLETGTACSAVACALMCNGKAGCLSFNFIDASQLGGNCELNNQTLSSSNLSSSDAGWHCYYRYQ